MKLIQLTDNNFNEEEKIPTRVDYVEKREIDRSALYSFNGPFPLLHADVGNLELLGKNATVPKYVSLSADLYSSKVYVYPMCSRKQILQKMKLFYDEEKEKRKNKPMRLQVNNEFQQIKIQDLNDRNNVKIFTTSIRVGKAFAAEQKIRELKRRVAKLSIQKLKISLTKIILNSAVNMNSIDSEKYGISLKEIKTLFNFHRIEKNRQVHKRLDRFDKKKYKFKTKKNQRKFKHW